MDKPISAAENYTMEEAVTEAKRCLLCKNKPCAKGCSVDAPIPEFISHIAKGCFEEAYQTLAAAAPEGRIHGEDAEPFCIRAKKNAGIAIGRLERFAIDWHNSHS